jgi:Secretion system C-terminal sorting domain
MKKQFGFLPASLVFFFYSLCSVAQVQTPRYIQMSETTGGFYEYLPQGYPAAGQKYPLLFFIHGSGETGPGTAASLPAVLRNGPPKLINQGIFPSSFTVNNETFRFIVISPQFTMFPSVNDINNSLNYLVANYPIDINRIYLTGLSMGGGAAWYYPGYNSYFANRIAATVPVCGATDPLQFYASNIAAANLPVWATHNIGDGTVPVSNTNTLVSLINSAPVPPSPLAKKTIFNVNGHDAWTQTYDPSFRENGLNIYEWMLQFKRNFVVLPLTGLEFNAVKNGDNQVSLFWKTETEVNNPGFSILRSTDGIDFRPIGYVVSTAAASAGASYHFTDVNPMPGRDYYRLQMTGSGGEKTYGPIRIVNFGKNTGVSFYPNPVSSFLKISTTKTLVNAQVSISNAGGQIVLQMRLNGTVISPVSMDNIPAGVYFASIEEGGVVQRFRLIKQ